jgi:hypothetical protein
MLGTKAVKIEVNIDAVLAEVKNVILALKSGKSPAQVGLEELLKLQQVVAEVQAVPGELKESLPAAVRTVVLGAEDIAYAVLGVSEPL